ncbi:MAG: DUF4136 domain-containing protein [Bacteroidota bacterium]
MTNIIRFFFILSIVTLSGCAANRVVSFNNPDFADRNYESFRIITLKTDTLTQEDRTIYEEINNEVKRQMEFRGYEAVAKNSDLLVRYQLYANNRVEEVTNNVFWPGNFNNPNNMFFSTRNITKSILLIDIHDRNAGKLVWQGSLDLNYSAYKKRKFEEIMPQIIEDIFATYQFKHQ